MTTHDAIIRIQSILGVPQDGDIGPVTLHALGGADAATAKQVQAVLHTQEDGQIGPASLEALDHLRTLPQESPWPPAAPDPDATIHSVQASSFADPDDVAAFTHCKSQGRSDLSCFSVGDNGVGKWGDSCVAGSGPKCALPPEYWAQFGAEARHKPVKITVGELSVVALMDDTMPHLANIRNGAGIDVNYDAWKALGFTPPQMRSATWSWA